MNTPDDAPDAVDFALARATQGGLPLVPRPWLALGERLGLTEHDVMRRFQAMLDKGIVRRIGAAPNHYALGYAANGMSVWDVADERVDALGEKIAALDFVTHCYRRPRRPPHWPYNLFAMLHGAERAEVERQMYTLRSLLGGACRSGDVLFSSRILKKTGLRLTGDTGGKNPACSA
ncbi:MAG: Lrp/AsnC family transcriptional regulator [Azoarcus sp.]|jgi:DNA-binding Lrp family transcriptional regulator|nr:Lrp/AsnC family transcriptional regulator [Azoarcus sp.]